MKMSDEQKFERVSKAIKTFKIVLSLQRLVAT